MKIATIETIHSIRKHPNADSLALAKVLGYQVIIGLDSFQEGDKVVFIQPDTLLPEEPWAEMFRKRSSRVKACKLRGEWSLGIALKLYDLVPFEYANQLEVGDDISEYLGVTKWEPPMPQDLSAAGVLPRGIPKTDEETWQNLELPYGSVVDVSLKIDGCLEGNSVINTEKGELTIKDIVDGEMIGLNVLTMNVETNELEYMPILAVASKEDPDREWYEIETETGEMLTLTANHRVWIPALSCYRRVDQLVVGDAVCVSTLT